MSFRVFHRYLGFFLAGIMMLYAISGITLIFRKTNTFKVEVKKEMQFEEAQLATDLGEALGIRRFEIIEETAEKVVFSDGTYDKATYLATWSEYKLPAWLDKITHLHKATNEDPLYYFNIFFGCALLFFAISAFFMFTPSSPLFKRGIWFAIGGLLLAIIMLYV